LTSAHDACGPTNTPSAMRAGSHFNLSYRLKPYPPLDQSKTVNVGGHGARLTALLEGEVEATSLIDQEISMADRLGLRCIMANTLKMLWRVDERNDCKRLNRFFHVLQRAAADLDHDPASCLPLWQCGVPPEFKGHPWDYGRFDLGECFHYEPLRRAEYH
jgi:hypothetical protein